MERSRKNNLGLTLVELIIAIAIFAIVGLGVASFMSFGSHTFGLANKNVKLQYEQQVVVNRVRDILLETSRGVSYDDSSKTLYVFSDIVETDPVDSTKTITLPFVTRLRFDEDESKLYIANDKFPKGTKLADVVSWSPSTENLLSDTLKAFEVDLGSLKDNKVIVTFTFAVGDKEVVSRSEIALRNVISEIDDSTDIDKLYKEFVIEADSKIKDVVITRDGTVFAQSRTDTIAMAGDSTTVDYDAIVTPKKYYTGEVDTSVTWSIDTSSVLEGYEQCISINSDGMVTVKNAGGKTPADYMKTDGYFVIKAESNADSRKFAKLRIKVTADGVYPVKITFDTPVKTEDTKNGLLRYKFKNSIEYTANVKDPITGNMVNPLTGDGVYSKITYTIKEQLAGTETIPTGAGFSTTNTDGEFIAVKSMEGKTYTIVATVIQKDKNGQVVQAEYRLTVDEVPDIEEDETELKLLLPETMDRNRAYTPSVSWTNGAPTYEENGVKKQYYYWFDWKVELVDPNKESRPNAISFKKNVYFKWKENWQDKQGQSASNLSRSYNILPMYIDAPLDWSKAFAIKVTVIAKVSKTNNLSGVEKEFKSEASGTIQKVALSLTPVKNIKLKDVSNATYVSDTSNEPSISFTRSNYNGKDCYMVFEPTFTGIKLEANDINGLNWNYNPAGKLDISVKKEFVIAGQQATSVYMKWPDSHWSYLYSVWFDNGLNQPNGSDKYYMYLRLVQPYSWRNYDFSAMRWYCRVQGPSDNEVYATFPTGNDFMEYKLKFFLN